MRSDPVTKHIEYSGHYDSSMITGRRPKVLAGGPGCLRFFGKRHWGVWTKSSQITTLGRRRGRNQWIRAVLWGKRVTTLLFCAITPIVTCATALGVGHD